MKSPKLDLEVLDELLFILITVIEMLNANKIVITKQAIDQQL